MKKRSKPKSDDELRPEYDLRELLRHAVKGKYAARFRQGTNLVLLGPGIARPLRTHATADKGLPLAEIRQAGDRDDMRQSGRSQRQDDGGDTL